MDNVIAAIKAGGENPSDEQCIEICVQLGCYLCLMEISSKSAKREASKDRVKRAIANIEALEKNAEAIELLNIRQNVSEKLCEAKQEMQALLEKLESNRIFKTAGFVNAINHRIRHLYS